MPQTIPDPDLFPDPLNRLGRSYDPTKKRIVFAEHMLAMYQRLVSAEASVNSLDLYIGGVEVISPTRAGTFASVDVYDNAGYIRASLTADPDVYARMGLDDTTDPDTAFFEASTGDAKARLTAGEGFIGMEIETTDGNAGFSNEGFYLGPMTFTIPHTDGVLDGSDPSIGAVVLPGEVALVHNTATFGTYLVWHHPDSGVFSVLLEERS